MNRNKMNINEMNKKSREDRRSYAHIVRNRNEQRCYQGRFKKKELMFIQRNKKLVFLHLALTLKRKNY